MKLLFPQPVPPVTLLTPHFLGACHVFAPVWPSFAVAPASGVLLMMKENVTQFRFVEETVVCPFFPAVDAEDT